MKEDKKIRIEQRFYLDELVDSEIYFQLAMKEKNHKLKELLKGLVAMEKKHLNLWKDAIEEHGYAVQEHYLFVRLKVLGFLLARRLLGVAFIVKLLGRTELKNLSNYEAIIKNKNVRLTKIERRYLYTIIKDEKQHEIQLNRNLKKYEKTLDHIRSIVLGLNDGIVEILAVIAGLAIIATSSLIVVLAGIIVGIAGTLSMAGGVYLSSKSDVLVENVSGEKERATTPIKDALYTGLFYLIGSIIVILPFIFGMLGYYGILLSIIMASLALVIASTIIAIISNANVTRRCIESLAISLGTAFVGIMLGSIFKAYFGITI